MKGQSPPHVVLLGAAVQKLRAGQVHEADAMLQAALKQAPRDPDVLAMASGVARQLGRADEALDLIRRAIKQQPRHAPLHNSLGAALRAKGDLPGARQAFQRAAQLQPDLFDAAFNLGLVLDAQGDHAEAAAHLRRAVTLAPERAEAHEALGNVLVRVGQVEDGVTSLLRAEQLRPASGSIAHNLGVAYEALEDDQRALAAYAQAVQRAPNQVASWGAIGNLQRRLGGHVDAIAAYRRAIELAPGNLDWHQALLETIWQAGGGVNLSSYPYAIQRLPQDVSLRRAFAYQLNRTRAHEEAEREARAALSLAPDNAEIHDVLGQTLIGQKRYEEAIGSYGRAAALAPKDVALLGRYAEALVRNAQFGDAHDVLTAALRVAPYDQENLARMTILLRLLGEERAYGALADYDALSKAIAVKPPEGYRDTEAFHAALAPYLLGKHLAKQHPTDQTLRGGTQTLGSLFADPHPLIQGLRQSLYDAVAGFVANLPEDKAHPFFGRRGKGLKFSGSWSVRLGCGGFHTNHIHPAGWISSAYYVSLPTGVAKPDDRQGWFKMGETNPDTSPDLPAERWVRPTEGKLVLFPSYFWHGTQAFEEGSERLTVAFDVVPTEG